MQENRNSHTTSTKCQYQAAASKQKWRVGVNWPAMARPRHTARKIVPTMTWKPWKPVAMKNVEPSIASKVPAPAASDVGATSVNGSLARLLKRNVNGARVEAYVGTQVNE